MKFERIIGNLLTPTLKSVGAIAIVIAFSASLETKAQSKTERAQSGITQEVVSEQDYEKGKPVGKQKIIFASKYDSTGRLVEEIDYKDGKPDNTVTMVYDADGKKIKEIEKNASGKIVKTVEYKYENGLRTERITYDANNQIKSKKFYKYEKAQ